MYREIKTFEYEQIRLGRYGNVRQNVYYSPEEWRDAYLAWALYTHTREDRWDAYCDIRDAVPPGTNDKIRKDWCKFRALSTH
jgi:hypothetical protein